MKSSLPPPHNEMRDPNLSPPPPPPPLKLDQVDGQCRQTGAIRQKGHHA